MISITSLCSDVPPLRSRSGCQPTCGQVSAIPSRSIPPDRGWAVDRPRSERFAAVLSLALVLAATLVGPLGRHTASAQTPAVTIESPTDDDHGAKTSDSLSRVSPCAPKPLGMVSWYPLDDQPGDTSIVDVQQGLNGTPMQGGAVGAPNTPNSIPGQVNDALQFYTGGGWVEVSSAAPHNFGTGPFSIDAWVKYLPTTQTEPIVHKRDATGGYFLYLGPAPNSGNAVRPNLQIGSQIFKGPAINAQIGSWIFVAASRTGANGPVTVYLGEAAGQLQSWTTQELPGLSASSNANLLMGRWNQNPHIGIALDELELFNSTVSANDFQAIYDAGPSGKCRTGTANFTATSPCFGQAMQFTNTSIGGLTYSWNFGDGGTSTLPNPSHTYAQAGTYSVKLCINGGTAAPECITKSVTVSAGPAKPVINGPPCISSGGQYYCVQSYPVGYTVAWSLNPPGAGTVGSVPGSPWCTLITWSSPPPVSAAIMVTVTDPQGCRSTTVLEVRVCNQTAYECCRKHFVGVINDGIIAVSGGHKLMGTLLAGSPPVSHVTVDLVSASQTMSSPSCGVGGPLSTYLTSGPVTLTGGGTVNINNQSLPPQVPYSHQLDFDWGSTPLNMASGVPVEVGLALPPAPIWPCRDTLTLCVRYTVTFAKCEGTCEVLECYSIKRKGKIHWPDLMSTAEVGTPLPVQPKLQLQDDNGSPLKGARGEVTLSILPGSGAPDAMLTGTVTAAVEDGQATFHDVAVDKAGRGYVLLATFVSTDDPELVVSGESNAFDVAGGSLPSTPDPTLPATRAPTPTPPVTPDPTLPATPATSVAGTLSNVSTRASVGTGDDVMIGGFIVRNGEVKVILRALGRSLLASGVANPLLDPNLRLFSGQTVIAANDNWETGNCRTEAPQGLWPKDPREACLVMTLAAGSFTAIVDGVGRTTGIALVEAYHAGGGGELSNISTRTKVLVGDDVMIGGFITRSQPMKAIVRGLGRSLAASGVPAPLQNPRLRLFSGQSVIASNDDWEAGNCKAEAPQGLWPKDPREACLVIDLPPGPYTAIVDGVSATTGISLVEVFNAGR